MKGQYRSVNFDLSTKAMKETLGSSTKGYRIIQKSMQEFGFSHRQGSGYRSDKPLTKEETKQFVKAFGKANPWLADCVKAFDVTNSGRVDYDFTETLRAAAKEAQGEKENVTNPSSASHKEKINLETFLSTSYETAAPTTAATHQNVRTLSLEEFMGLSSSDNDNVMD